MHTIENYLQTTCPRLPPEQRAYFLALYQKYLAQSEHNTHVDLCAARYHFFSDMDPAERAEYVFDLSLVEDRLRHEERARSLRVAVLEMNGGLGSSLGLDPAAGHAKSTGVRFEAPLPSGEHAQLSLLEAKLLWMQRNAHRFGALGLIPWNTPSTLANWDQQLDEIFLDDRGREFARSYRDALEEAGVQVFPSQLQYAFPRLRANGAPFEQGELEQRFAPGGHGQVLYQLYYNGQLLSLCDQGYDVLVLVNADGVAAKPNPLICSLLMEHEVPAAMVTTDRMPIDAKGGICVIDDGRVSLVELAQVAPAQRELFQRIGMREGDAPQPFNTNTVYVHLRRFFDLLQEVQMRAGPHAVEKLLMPELIINHKRVALSSGSAEVMQLEGAIGSVVVKIPGARLFNIDVNERIAEFTPIKYPSDVVYLFDSDAYAFDVHTGCLQARVSGMPAEFNLEGWSGWRSLDETRASFGRPQMQQLQSLHVHGPVKFRDSCFEGKVSILNHSGKMVDLNAGTAFPKVNGRMLFKNVVVHIDVEGIIQTKPAGKTRSNIL